MGTGQVFVAEVFLPRGLAERITDVRIHRPQVIEEEAAARRRRASLAPDGRLVILAADHPARGVLRAGEDRLAMGHRHGLLARILRVLISQADGVMATADILEELIILHRLDKERGGPGFLDGKVLVGCLNRGGLHGSAFELDDRLTAFTPERIAALGLDGAKVMVRLDLSDPASLRTLEACAHAVTACHQRGIPVFIEAMMVARSRRGYRVVRTPEAMVTVVNIATGLGASSARTWLKVPFCPQFERVAAATTCPLLLLGGETRGAPGPLLAEVAAAMRAGPSVRGALVGRNLTYPGPEDPYAAAEALWAVVHQGASVEEALARMREARGRHMDRFAHLAAA
jgi:DhnA family fructose-bisphosphate aldolase class Ia